MNTEEIDRRAAAIRCQIADLDDEISMGEDGDEDIDVDALSIRRLELQDDLEELTGHRD